MNWFASMWSALLGIFPAIFMGIVGLLGMIFGAA